MVKHNTLIKTFAVALLFVAGTVSTGAYADVGFNVSNNSKVNVEVTVVSKEGKAVTGPFVVGYSGPVTMSGAGCPTPTFFVKITSGKLAGKIVVVAYQKCDAEFSVELLPAGDDGSDITLTFPK